MGGSTDFWGAQKTSPNFMRLVVREGRVMKCGAL